MARLAKSAAISYSALAAQIQRQTINVQQVSYQNAAHKFNKLVVFFLTHIVGQRMNEICSTIVCIVYLSVLLLYVVLSQREASQN